MGDPKQLDVARVQLGVVGADPQCDRCKHFSLATAECRVGEDIGRYFGGSLDCPRFFPEQGIDEAEKTDAEPEAGDPA